MDRQISKFLAERPSRFATGFLFCNKPSIKASLSEILEIEDVPQRFFLSPKACKGILRRAEKRGKALPPSLRAALLAVAMGPGPVASEPTSTATADSSLKPSAATTLADLLT